VTAVRLVCLANSWKRGGRCIAGKTVHPTHRWYRPVTSRQGGELSRTEYSYPDGSEVALLDLLEYQALRPSPQPHHPEDILIADGRHPVKVGTFPLQNLPDLVDHPADLWLDATTASQNRDRIPDSNAVPLHNSLYLIPVPGFETRREITFSGRPRLRCNFMYAGLPYNLAITDPTFTEQYVHGPENRQFGAALLTISLSEPFDGYLYKLVAALLDPSSPNLRPTPIRPNAASHLDILA
jgi:hypothetical protein